MSTPTTSPQHRAAVAVLVLVIVVALVVSASLLVDAALTRPAPGPVASAPTVAEEPDIVPAAGPPVVPAQQVRPGAHLQARPARPTAGPGPADSPHPAAAAGGPDAELPTAGPGPASTAPPSSAPTPQPAAPEQPVPATVFRVSSFNVLGASHTGPGSARPGFAAGPARIPGVVQLLTGAGVSVAGLQEFQPSQAAAFAAAAPGWQAWPGAGSRAGVNSVAFRTDTWTLLEGHTIAVPYFAGRPVAMPYVLLRHRGTGQQLWVTSFHNPADARGPAQRWRDEAVRREAALVTRLYATGVPVVLTGDFNDRDAFFCPLAAATPVRSADGSAWDPAGCRVAPHPGVDWLVGTPEVSFSEFHRVRGGLVARTSDHPFVWTQASIGGP